MDLTDFDIDLVIIANGWKPLTFVTKRSILDVAAALDPPLWIYHLLQQNGLQTWGLVQMIF